MEIGSRAANDSALPPEADDGEYETRQDITYFVACLTLIVATVAVSFRIYTRKYLINQLGPDDYCAITALLLVFSCNFAVAYNTNFGLGQHIWTVPPEWIPLYLRAFYVSILFYNASLMAIKMTFLAQYYRIFKHTSRSTRFLFGGVAAFVGCWATSQLLIAIFTCHPIDAYWNLPKDQSASMCIADHPFWEINAAGNIVTDVMVLLLPIPIIEQLSLPRRQKHILGAIFLLGLFTVAISLIRIRFLKQYEDFTWENVESSGWSMGEIASGLTCSCLPTLRPLINHYMPWMSSTAERYKHYRTTGGHTREIEKDLEHGTRASGNSDQTGVSESVTTPGEPPAPAAVMNSRVGHIVATNHPEPRTKDPHAMLSPALSSTSGLFSLSSRQNLPSMSRLDSPDDSSDGVVGLHAARREYRQQLSGGIASLSRSATYHPSTSRVSSPLRTEPLTRSLSLERGVKARPSADLSRRVSFGSEIVHD